MPCEVLSPDGTRREVKNLGWLLSHRDEVEQFTVYSLRSGGGSFQAHLTGDRHFICRFSSRAVLRDWLNRRRAWRGLPVMWRTADHVHMLSLPIPDSFGG